MPCFNLILLLLLIIIMFMKVKPVILFLNPEDEVGPSISSSVVLCTFVLSVYIVVLVLVFYLCPPHSAKGAHPYRKAYRSRGIKMAAPPLDSPCDRPLTYPGGSKKLVKSAKGRSGSTLVITLWRRNISVLYKDSVRTAM
jgi:hypothetical protein